MHYICRNITVNIIFMNTRILLASLLLTACSFSLFSQEYKEVEGQPKMGAYKTTFQKNKFKDNWTFSFGSGAQILLGEDDSKGDFGSRITYAPTFSVSKYFSPIWGLKVGFTGGSLHGYNDGLYGTYRKWNNGSKAYQGAGYIGTPGYPSGVDAHKNMNSWDPSWAYRGWGVGDGFSGVTTDGNGQWAWDPGNVPDRSKALYMQHVRYVGMNINFMFDVITLFGNYNPKRFFDLTPFAGIGVYHTFKHMGNDAYTMAGINGGLTAKFRLSDKVKLFAEVTGTMLPDDFDGHAGDDVAFDAVAQATGGISFTVGKSTWDVAEPTNYGLINDLNNKINDLQAALAIPCPTCPPCPEPVVIENIVEEKPIVFLPDPVFFRIDKSVIDAPEWEKIEKAVSYLKKHPDANVVVTGYADKKTAYPAYNLKLSERRSKVVAKALIDKYGINPMRVSINWEGDQIQPFNINEWNRVVIFVLE